MQWFCWWCQGPITSYLTIVELQNLSLSVITNRQDCKWESINFMTLVRQPQTWFYPPSSGAVFTHQKYGTHDALVHYSVLNASVAVLPPPPFDFIIVTIKKGNVTFISKRHFHIKLNVGLFIFGLFISSLLAMRGTPKRVHLHNFFTIFATFW